jgi:uncharacterized protein YqjF (DUF2071 family)
MNDLYSSSFRPYPPQDRPWRMTQSWHNLLFAHWPLEPQVLAPLLPEPLVLDTFDGQAWLGVIAFRLDHIRLRGLPEVPFVRGFAEINVRTYVRLGERRGIYFLSLDTDHLLTIASGRPWFRLPYQYSRMHFAESDVAVRFHSRRAAAGASPPAEFAASYAPASAPFTVPPGSLEQWLTERYSYFAPGDGQLYRCDIYHQHWQLQQALAEISHNTMPAAHGLPTPDAAPLLHYAHDMKALIWPVHRVTTRAADRPRILSALPAWA